MQAQAAAFKLLDGLGIAFGIGAQRFLFVLTDGQRRRRTIETCKHLNLIASHTIESLQGHVQFFGEFLFGVIGGNRHATLLLSRAAGEFVADLAATLFDRRVGDLDAQPGDVLAFIVREQGGA